MPVLCLSHGLGETEEGLPAWETGWIYISQTGKKHNTIEGKKVVHSVLIFRDGSDF